MQLAPFRSHVLLVYLLLKSLFVLAVLLSLRRTV
jgi:hypothetical protein